jgi:hypothetical protein
MFFYFGEIYLYTAWLHSVLVTIRKSGFFGGKNQKGRRFLLEM